VTDVARQEEFVRRHQKLVLSIANKLAKSLPVEVDVDDLLAYGQKGLLEAAQRYNPEHGASFVTFAYYRIRGAMYDGLKKMTPLVKRNRTLAFREHADAYLRQRAAEPRPADAGEAIQVLSEMVSDLAVVYLIDTEELEERPDLRTPDPSVLAERHLRISALRKLIGRLPRKEMRLLELMYFEGYNLTEAAKKLKISKGWASRLHSKAISTVRRAALASAVPRDGPFTGKRIRV